jgi:hypothetical protein
MNWMLKRMGQFVHAWPGSPHQKQMSAVMSFGHGGSNALKAGGVALDMPEAWMMGSRSHKTVVGSMATWGRGLLSIPPMFESVCTGWVILDEV